MVTWLTHSRRASEAAEMYAPASPRSKVWHSSHVSFTPGSRDEPRITREAANGSLGGRTTLGAHAPAGFTLAFRAIRFAAASSSGFTSAS